MGNIVYSLDIQGHLLKRYLDPRNIPKTPNLRRYDWMSRARVVFFLMKPQGLSKKIRHPSQIHRSIQKIQFLQKDRWLQSRNNCDSFFEH